MPDLTAALAPRELPAPESGPGPSSASDPYYSSDEVDEKQMRVAVTEVLREHFKPEFLNRVDDIVIFHQLSREQIGDIIEIQLERLRKLLAERDMHLTLDESAKQLLAREGYDPLYGARPLKRAIQTLIQNPLASKLLRGEILPGQTVRVSADGDQMQFDGDAADAADAAKA